MAWLNSFKKQTSAVADLCRSILEVSYRCGQDYKSIIEEKFGKDSKETARYWIQVQYEFLFFFTHMVMRRTFAKLGNDKRIELQNLLAPVLVEATTDGWFGHWPEDLKEGVRREFYHNMNAAELEYSECKELMTKDDPFSDNALFSKLSKNIARLCGYEDDPLLIVRCVGTVCDNYMAMKLDERIDAVGKEI